jgi:hypothetical protein
LQKKINTEINPVKPRYLNEPGQQPVNTEIPIQTKQSKKRREIKNQ